MALWDNLSKKASETTAKAVQQAKILSETARLNGLISDEEKKINSNYYQIGKLYASIHANDYEDPFAGMIVAVADSEQKIGVYRAQIQDIKGVIRCEKCGAEVAKGAAFCSACGAAMLVAAPVDISKFDKCVNCGATVDKGMRFCTSCGKPMSAPIIPAATQTEASAEPIAIAPTQISDVQPEEPAKRFCTHCGAAVDVEMRFCTECGKPMPVPEIPAATQTEAVAEPTTIAPTQISDTQTKEPAKRFCTHCGAALEPDVLFCTECGTKL